MYTSYLQYPLARLEMENQNQYDIFKEDSKTFYIATITYVFFSYFYFIVIQNRILQQDERELKMEKQKFNRMIT